MTHAGPVLTQQFHSHATGPTWTRLTYRVIADGKPTEILFTKRTNGAPQYRVTEYRLDCGEESIDITPPHPAPGFARQWILDHILNTSTTERTCHDMAEADNR